MVHCVLQDVVRNQIGFAVPTMKIVQQLLQIVRTIVKEVHRVLLDVVHIQIGFAVPTICLVRQLLLTVRSNLGDL